MSLIGALLDVARATKGDTPPRVPYTAGGSSILGNWHSAGGGAKAQLDMTTSESTLFSVLDLLSSTTAAVTWKGWRKQAGGQAANSEPVEVTAEQSLAVKLWNRPNKFMTGKFARTLGQWHYDSVGETWIVVDFWDKARTVPKSWWPVRPDRMFPVPDPDDYLAGYMYVGPDGTRVPLDLNEVLRITRPHPFEPHRGIGPVQALLTALGTSMSAQQWISTFFRNDATPGGIIEIEQGLEDADYNRMRLRWNEQHKGVNRAHRVAILEYGKWIPTAINMKDMQFTEVRTLTRDQILEAFRIHPHKMGISEKVNLANATAAGPTYEKDSVVPRLDNWDELANGPFLAMFGQAGADIELHYENPVPEDRENLRADEAAKVDNAVKLIGVGFEPGSVLREMGLPELPMAAVAEPAADTQGETAPAPPPSPEDGAGSDAAAKATAIAVVAQKLYLAVEGNAIITNEEARQILIDAGAPIAPGPLQTETPELPAVAPSPGALGLPPAPEPVPAEGEPTMDGGSE